MVPPSCPGLLRNSEATKTHTKQDGAIPQVVHHPKRTKKTGSAQRRSVVGSDPQLLPQLFLELCLHGGSEMGLDAGGLNLTFLLEKNSKASVKFGRTYSSKHKVPYPLASFLGLPIL